MTCNAFAIYILLHYRHSSFVIDFPRLFPDTPPIVYYAIHFATRQRAAPTRTYVLL